MPRLPLAVGSPNSPESRTLAPGWADLIAWLEIVTSFA